MGDLCSDPWLPKLACCKWNTASLVRKEADLVHEVGRYQLDIAGLTSRGSGTSFLESVWTPPWSWEAVVQMYPPGLLPVRWSFPQAPGPDYRLYLSAK